MIGILHGYLLEGSGSNLWTREVVRGLCRRGETVHLVCQENHPELYDFIAEAWRWQGERGEQLFARETPYPGRCVLHRPAIGDTLPVYVWDAYEAFDRVVPMIELTTAELEAYLARNVEVVTRVVRDHGVRVLHANHAVLQSVVAERVAAATGVPFAIMPHGSAIEYAVKRDPRLLAWAEGAFAAAARVLTIGPELRARLRDVLVGVEGLDAKMVELNLGVDTSLFEPIERGERAGQIAALAADLEGAPRGKTAASSAAMLVALAGDASSAGLAAAARAAPYDAKLPDAGVETRLAAVDWEREPIILFVGRLVASKGAHAIVAALPLILADQPQARLVVVGHGPLRELLEALVWALGRGDGELVAALATWGKVVEAGEPQPLDELRAFVDGLRARGELDAYLAAARAHLRAERVIFTGYLTHPRLRRLFACADVAIFPSVVAEAGPLVFLEALASGCFPIGTYFAGMAASIDAVASAMPAADAEIMKLCREPDRLVQDIAARTTGALALGGRHRQALRRIAVERFDWQSVAAKLAGALGALGGAR